MSSDRISDEEQQKRREGRGQRSEEQRKQFDALPRSIRWRVHLELLELPGVEQRRPNHECVAAGLSVATSDGSVGSAEEATVSSPEDGGDPLLGMRCRASNEPAMGDRLPAARAAEAHVVDTKAPAAGPLQRLFFRSSPRCTAPHAAPASFETNKLREALQALNSSSLHAQRSRYDALAKQHYWACSPLAIIDDDDLKVQLRLQAQETRSQQRASKKDAALAVDRTLHTANTNLDACDDDEMELVDDASWGPTNGKSSSFISKSSQKPTTEPTSSAKGADPLSAIAMLQEQQEQEDRKRDFEYRRNTARMHRPSNKHKPSFATTDSANEAEKFEKKKQETCAGSRWTEFYSSREVIDIIDKDLMRLPPDHHVCFHHRKQLLLFIARCNGAPLQPIGQLNVDSLMSPLDNEDDEVKRSRDERSNMLSEILFVYAKEHPAMGYRQGMHEILSHVFLAFEMDFFEMEANDGTVTLVASTVFGNDNEGGKLEALLDATKIMNDAFILFEAIMTRLSPAYEVFETQSLSSVSSYDCLQAESPMEIMGKSIMHKIRNVAGDEALYHFMMNLSIPPQLYCTRWVRLMFTREIVRWCDVMELWDIFFGLISPERGNREVDDTDAKTLLIPEEDAEDLRHVRNLMNVLEVTAASMILLIRNKLIPAPLRSFSGRRFQSYYSVTEEEPLDANDCINLLMNYPPIENASLLIDTLTSMTLQQQQHGTTQLYEIDSNCESEGLAHKHVDEDKWAVVDLDVGNDGKGNRRNRRQENERSNSLNQFHCQQQQHSHQPYQPVQPTVLLGNAMARVSYGFRGAWGHIDSTIQSLASNSGKEASASRSASSNEPLRASRNPSGTDDGDRKTHQIHSPNTLDTTLLGTKHFELALRLENSVEKLMEYLVTETNGVAKLQLSTQNPQSQQSLNLRLLRQKECLSGVPVSVWDALLEIESVRNALLSDPTSLGDGNS